MRLHILVRVTTILLMIAANASAQTKNVAERLGYPADSKLLIVHADDLAVAHSVNAASFDALDRNAITSASVMVPCPWLTEVAAYARNHPDADLGLHLTLTSEWKIYRWAPLNQNTKFQVCLTRLDIFGQKQSPQLAISSPKKQNAKFAHRSNVPSQRGFTPPISTLIWER